MCLGTFYWQWTSGLGFLRVFLCWKEVPVCEDRCERVHVQFNVYPECLNQGACSCVRAVFFIFVCVCNSIPVEIKFLTQGYFCWGHISSSLKSIVGAFREGLSIAFFQHQPRGVCQHIHLFRQHISHAIAKITLRLLLAEMSLFFPPSYCNDSTSARFSYQALGKVFSPASRTHAPSFDAGIYSWLPFLPLDRQFSFNLPHGASAMNASTQKIPWQHSVNVPVHEHGALTSECTFYLF